MSSRELIDLSGQVAVVTGAARGQGRAHARRLAAAGADVVVMDIADQIPAVPYPMSTPEDLAETVRLVEETGRRCLSLQVDVRDAAAVEQAFDTVLEELGRLDVVVANAGIVLMSEPWSTTDEQWAAVMDVNVNGVFHTLRAGSSRMVERGTKGSLICTSSVCSVRSQLGLGVYTVSKHAVVGMVKAFARELGVHGVRVNVVQPGNVDTPMVNNAAVYERLRPDLESPTREEAAAVFATMNAMPVAWVEDDDISAAVVWLASEQARYVTGAEVPVDAGLLLV
jgi:(+)-trans-carveol dehydrogenase